MTESEIRYSVRIQADELDRMRRERSWRRFRTAVVVLAYAVLGVAGLTLASTLHLVTLP